MGIFDCNYTCQTYSGTTVRNVVLDSLMQIQSAALLFYGKAFQPTKQQSHVDEP